MIEKRRVCLLTGASGTLGNAFCRRHAGRYQIVAVWSRRPPLVASQEQQVLDPLGEERDLPENRFPVFTIRTDIADPRATARLVDRVLERFGRIDLVVHAAGFSRWAPLLEDALLDSFERHFIINARAPLTLTVQVAKSFWAGRVAENASANRNVILVTSTAALRVYPGYGQSAYGASKAAANLLSQHLASELKPLGIRANALAPNSFPGIVQTHLVADALVQLDEGSATGRTLVLEANGQTWL